MSSKQTYRGSCAAGATANVFLSAHEATQKSRSVCSGLGRKAWGRLEVSLRSASSVCCWEALDVPHTLPLVSMPYARLNKVKQGKTRENQTLSEI